VECNGDIPDFLKMGPDLFATALRAVRRERPHAAAMHLSATISADVQACSERRTNAKNFRFGNS
jgi:hypothetical protein